MTISRKWVVLKRLVGGLILREVAVPLVFVVAAVEEEEEKVVAGMEALV